MPKRNVGGSDRFARSVIGMILVLAGFWVFGGVGSRFLGAALTMLGFMALMTGLVGYCPLYVPLGMSTARGSGSGQRSTAGCGCSGPENMCGSSRP